KDLRIKGAKALILGFTFKENCPDVRNTRVIDIYRELTQFGLQVEIYDPLIDVEETRKIYDIYLVKEISLINYEVIIVAVPHDDFANLKFSSKKENRALLFDIKSCLKSDLIDATL